MCRWLPIVLLLLSACKSAPQVRQQASVGPRTILKLDDPRIDESSGVAPSRLHPGQYYTHNDSGDTARFFRFDPKTKRIEEFGVPNGRNVDWEDMASVELAGRPYLFFGDIGDNRVRRKTVTVYRVPEPGDDESWIDADRIYVLSYPDGSHNAETLMVRPSTGDLYIVAKTSEGPSGVYKLDRPGSSGRYHLAKIGEVEVGGIMAASHLITGGAISPDGRTVVLRTYMGAYAFDASVGDFDGWTRVKPRFIKTNVDAQGEGITFALDGRTLITTSEGVPCQVSQIPFR